MAEIALGICIGIILTQVVRFIVFATTYATGTLKIDHSNPEKDQYLFEVKDLDTLNKKKFIELKIDHHANLSQD
jgi:hypothetical protein